MQRRAFGTADDVFSYSEQARRLTAGVEFITAPTGHDEIAQGKAKRRPGYWYTAGCNLALKTEQQREFPLHVVCSWLGNSPRIAQQSLLLVTEDDFAKAAGVAKVMVEW